METVISSIFILAVLALGTYSLGLCIYYLGKLAVSTFTYSEPSPQKPPAKHISQAKIGTTNASAPTVKPERMSFLDFVSHIFGMLPP
jgi:hypothetical protein